MLIESLLVPSPKTLVACFRQARPKLQDQALGQNSPVWLAGCVFQILLSADLAQRLLEHHTVFGAA